MKEINRETLLECHKLVQERDRVIWNSDYLFLREHNGFRPGAMHLFMGVSHGGKSTLVRSLIWDVLRRCERNKKVLVWLSEETVNDFLVEFMLGGAHMGREDVLTLAQKLLVFSEMEWPEFFEKNEMVKKKDYLRETLLREDISLVFFDNITTSAFYCDARPAEQSSFVWDLKEIISQTQKPLIIVAHTSSEISENTPRFISLTDIRGSKTITNLVQFFYILQRFHIEQTFYPTLRILKHRGQTVNDSMYFLFYDKTKNLFVKDKKIDFTGIKEAFRQRNIL